MVAAVNTAGQSANSSQVSATPELAIPPAPTNLVATAGNAQVGLSWSALSWSDELQRAAVNDEWGTVHGDCEPNDDQLHGRRGDERDDVLLRGGSSKHSGAECELQPGELDPNGVFDQLGSGFSSSSGLQLNGSTDAKRDAAEADQWGWGGGE